MQSSLSLIQAIHNNDYELIGAYYLLYIYSYNLEIYLDVIKSQSINIIKLFELPTSYYHRSDTVFNCAIQTKSIDIVKYMYNCIKHFKITFGYIVNAIESNNSSILSYILSVIPKDTYMDCYNTISTILQISLNVLEYKNMQIFITYFIMCKRITWKTIWKYVNKDVLYGGKKTQIKLINILLNIRNTKYYMMRAYKNMQKRRLAKALAYSSYNDNKYMIYKLVLEKI